MRDREDMVVRVSASDLPAILALVATKSAGVGFTADYYSAAVLHLGPPDSGDCWQLPAVLGCAMQVAHTCSGAATRAKWGYDDRLRHAEQAVDRLLSGFSQQARGELSAEVLAGISQTRH